MVTPLGGAVRSVGLCAVVVLCCGAILATAQETGAIQMPLTVFRWHAYSAPLPEYPESAVRLRQDGRVVAQVIVGTNGSVKSAAILDASYPALGSAVSVALQKWQFRPFISSSGGKQEFLVSGRLIFYFTLNGTQPAVVDANASRLVAEERAYRLKNRH